MNSAEERISDEGIALEGVGVQLKTAREARKLSVADVAHALKISPRQVELLEASAWNDLPGHTFVRGFVRNYGRFLHLDAEALLRQLEAAPVPKPPQLNLPRSTEVTLPQPGVVQRKDFVTMGLGALLVLVAALAFFMVPDGWWSGDVTTIVHRNPEPAPASQPAPPPAAATVVPSVPGAPTEGTVFPPGSPEAAALAGQQAAAVSGAMPTQPTQQKTTAPAPLPAAGATSPGVGAVAAVPAAAAAQVMQVSQSAVRDPASGRMQAEFSVSQLSWVEVRDKAGVLLLAENVAAGARRSVSGVPPLAVVVGNAAGVTLTVNGRAVRLSPNPGTNVARVTLE